MFSTLRSLVVDATSHRPTASNGAIAVVIFLVGYLLTKFAFGVVLFLLAQLTSVVALVVALVLVLVFLAKSKHSV